MHHLICGISSLLHFINLIVFTLLVHLMLRTSPHHSHHLRSHHLSLRRPFTQDLKLISFTNPFLHSHSYSFRTAFTACAVSKGHWRCFSFFFWLRVPDKAEYSAFESTLNSTIVSYRIVSRFHTTQERYWQTEGRNTLYAIKYSKCKKNINISQQISKHLNSIVYSLLYCQRQWLTDIRAYMYVPTYGFTETCHWYDNDLKNSHHKRRHSEQRRK